MTTPCYPSGCSAVSQVRGEASSAWAPAPAGNAWIVNFNNGNSNNDHRNNKARVRAVRSVSGGGECQGDGRGAVTLQSLHQAWRRARRRKVPSSNQMQFESRWADRLLALQERMLAGSWSPSPTMCFVAARPKAREIHAPTFEDRVVHHWLVPQLEAAIDPGFIHDSYSNRVGKGTHAAVDRLQAFSRQLQSGTGGGWYLQMDIRNYFNSIHRPTLWRMLKRKMERSGLPPMVQTIAHALVRQSVASSGVIHCSTQAERAQVPPHKRLENAAPGCGLPIGNLSSQFLANLYLDALDQYCKHVLKVRRYIRFVDDFVLVHESRAQLLAWKRAIETFLRDVLRLDVKAGTRLQPLSTGVDFLGYVVYPQHKRVRGRVVRHARAALSGWAQRHVRRNQARATPRDYRHLQSVWASYEGHFSRANACRLRRQFHQKFPWLNTLTRKRRFHRDADDVVLGFRL